MFSMIQSYNCSSYLQTGKLITFYLYSPICEFLTIIPTQHFLSAHSIESASTAGENVHNVHMKVIEYAATDRCLQ